MPALTKDLHEPAQHLARAYYERVGYLLRLEKRPPVARDLLACDSRGLDALERAREEFRRAHPPCLHCGALRLIGWTLCWNCREALKEKEEAS